MVTLACSGVGSPDSIGSAVKTSSHNVPGEPPTEMLVNAASPR